MNRWPNCRPMLLLFFLFACGCGSTDVTTVGDDVPAEDPQTVEPDAEEPKVELVVANWEETQQMVAEHEDKIVVLDLWSTWCAPCKREFPNLVALQKKYPDQVVCMSLNVNYAGLGDETPESNREEVLEFLTAQSATFKNILCSDPDEELLSKIELDSVPAVYVFDQQGQIAQRFDNTTHDGDEFTYQADVIPKIEKLLAGNGI